jgi:hypothetical protein
LKQLTEQRYFRHKALEALFRTGSTKGRDYCLKSLDLSVTAAAKWLGVSRVTPSELLNGHNGVTAEMAIRRGGSTLLSSDLQPNGTLDDVPIFRWTGAPLRRVAAFDVRCVRYRRACPLATHRRC